MKPGRNWRVAVAVVLVVAAVLILSRDSWGQTATRLFFPNGWNVLNATPVPWGILAGVLVLVLVQCWQVAFRGRRVVAVIVALLLAASVVQVGRGLHGNAQDEARAYLAETRFWMPPYRERLPGMLPFGVVAGSRPGKGPCVRVGTGPVPVCIREGEPPEWSNPVGSLAAARRRLAAQNVTYLPRRGTWSAVRSHRGDVVEWHPRSGKVARCRYDGGPLSSIAERRRGTHFDPPWGYCDPKGGATVVRPAWREVGHRQRTIRTPDGAGVDRGGHAEWLAEIPPRWSPGPVYPLAVARKQAAALKWALAPRLHASVDWDPRLANPYLLESSDGHLDWVFRMTSSDDRVHAVTLVAAIPADETRLRARAAQDAFLIAASDRPTLERLRTIDKAF